MTEEEYQERNKRLWSMWLQAYEVRLKIDFEGNHDNAKTQFSERLNLMQSVNPRVVLRNYLAEEAIKSADKGDYTVAQQLFNSLTTPFKNPDMSLNNEVSSKDANLRLLVFNRIFHPFIKIPLISIDHGKNQCQFFLALSANQVIFKPVRNVVTRLNDSISNVLYFDVVCLAVVSMELCITKNIKTIVVLVSVTVKIHLT